ncbi:hypothetical protein HDV01_000747 [Terramyces sp. JEL0728]|nr:hypothetical protein HDV01_000747 [Terramyces sp. JEL0728]
MLGLLLNTLFVAVEAQSISDPQTVSQYAFDPVFWGTKLRKYVDCPISNAPTNVPSTVQRCQYPRTPIPSDPDFQGRGWTCDPGFFCPGQTEKFSCTPGFYCPENTMEPIYCPKGFFCSNDTKTIEYCPVGKFCPTGTLKPKFCLTYCPLGSFEAPQFSVIIIFLVVALLVYGFYHWKTKADSIREGKRKGELEQTAAAARFARNMQDNSMDKLERTFDIEFENLGLMLPSGVEIMKGVTGTLRAGRTCAIMGPSGAGKTTFVTLLTGKVPRTSGTVKLNGQVDELSNYSKLIGYVPQEDIMIRELTVRDILMHSARMRLPSSWEYHKVKAKVNKIISFLGMKHVASSIIGNEAERGISGGQRKRVNIGMELVAEPSVLFLDEPTSGLDSSTSFEVCKNLREIAQSQGLTVGAVIHSPSPATFRQFDDFLLLGKGGRVVYIGPREDAIKYFDYIGFACPPEESPSDFFMDVASGVVASQYDPSFEPSHLFEYWETRRSFKYAGARRMSPQEANQARENYLRQSKPELFNDDTIKKHKAHDYYGFTNYIAVALASILKEIWAFLRDILTELGQTVTGLFTQDKVRKNANIFLQGWFCMKRAVHQVYRNFNATLVDLALNFTAGLFISIAIQKFTYLGASPNEMCTYAPTNVAYQCQATVDTIRQAGMFIALGSLFVGISVAGNTFGYEKVVYWRDTASGMSVIPYYVAKALVDVPRILIGACVYFLSLITFFPYAQKFGFLLSVVICLHFYAFALGYALSTAVPYSKLAVYGTGFSLLWALVLSGVVPDLWDVKTSYPSVVQWFWEISAPRWAIEAIWIKEVSATGFNLKTDHFYDFDDYNLCITNMIKITLCWHLLSILGLKLFDRSKQK